MLTGYHNVNVGRNLNVHLCLFTWQYVFGYSYIRPHKCG
nr:MAG TPA: hypothetical protein [Caudoviricetes sp.]